MNYTNVKIQDDTNNGKTVEGTVPAGSTIADAVRQVLGPRDQSRMTPLMNGRHAAFGETLPDALPGRSIIITLTPNKLAAAA